MTRVNLIGAGKVGTTLLSLMKERGTFEIGDVLAARRENADAAVAAVGAGRAVTSVSDLREADFWFLAVPDDKIADVAKSLACSLGKASPLANPSPTVAVHCSGFLSAEALAPLRGHGWHVASCHPVLSFADLDVAIRQFPGTLCGIEGDPLAVRAAGTMMSELGGRVFDLLSDKKALYHAAAVFSNNFTVVLQAIALEAWSEAGVNRDVAQDLCARLLRSTLENVTAIGPSAALTGPAARGDDAVVQQQGAAVSEWQSEAGELYRRMSQLARRLKQDGATFPAPKGDELIKAERDPL